MRHISTLAAALLAATAGIGAAHAADAAGCVTPAPLPSALAGWNNSGMAVAAGNAAALAGIAPLAIGKGVDARLLPAGKVQFLASPADAGDSPSFGGMMPLHIATAGTYRIGLGAGAWIDVLAKGKALESVAHGHGPQCSGIRKVVDFRLQPGDYVIQLSAAEGAQLRLIVARLP